jgi:hypothetical protein
MIFLGVAVKHTFSFGSFYKTSFASPNQIIEDHAHLAVFGAPSTGQGPSGQVYLGMESLVSAVQFWFWFTATAPEMRAVLDLGILAVH